MYSEIEQINNKAGTTTVTELTNKALSGGKAYIFKAGKCVEIEKE